MYNDSQHNNKGEIKMKTEEIKVNSDSGINIKVGDILVKTGLQTVISRE
jgi:hypothetical protein